MIARAAEVPVVCRTFLLTIGLADRAIQVEDDLAYGLAVVNRINSAPGQIHERRQVRRLRQQVGLETTHLTGGSRMPLLCPAVDYVSHGWFDREPLGVVGVLVTGEPAEDRLPKLRRRGVLTVVAGALILQQVVSHGRQPEGVIEVAIGHQSSVAGDPWTAKRELQAAVEPDPQRFVASFTHWVLRPFQAVMPQTP